MAGGRQREFNKHEALDKAMKVFWSKGYVGASLTDLTKSMGINKPSMYATFGNKEQLFIQAMENYIENYASHHTQYLYQQNKTVKQKLRDYLISVLTAQCGEDTPKGCFVSLCVSEVASEDWPAEARVTVNEVKYLAETVLTAFFTQEQKNESNMIIETQQMAQYIVTVMHGLAVMARSGKPQEQLEQVIELSLSSF